MLLYGCKKIIFLFIIWLLFPILVLAMYNKHVYIHLCLTNFYLKMNFKIWMC